MRAITLSFLAGSLFLASCSTDLDVNAPYKEVPVVYGLLDVWEPVQYIRLQRAFQPDGQSALLFTSNPDSIYYPVNKVQVVLEEIRNQGVFTTTVLDTVWLPKSGSGTFGARQMLYKTPPGFKLGRSGQVLSEYRLRVNWKDDNSQLIRSQTVYVDSFAFTSGQSDIFLHDGTNFRISTPIIWNTARNGKGYEFALFFKWMEINKTTNDTAYRSLYWPINRSLKTNSTSGGDPMYQHIDGEQFYNYVAANLKADPNLRRVINPALDIQVLCSGFHLHTYIEVAKPDESLNDIKPEYTNIEGGFGIFSSRTNRMRKVNLSDESMNYLVSGKETGHLGFERP